MDPLQPSLIVIGLSARTAPVAVRERFCMDDARRHRAVDELVRAAGIDEIAAVANCERTEFIAWANDPAQAASSVLAFLTHECRLRSAEWRHFYRFTDEHALLHVLRVASGLDSIVLGDPEVLFQMRAAWLHAQAEETCGRSLDQVFEHALAAGERVRTETGIGVATFSLAGAAVELGRQIFGSLEKRRVLLVGAGRFAEQVARKLADSGAKLACVVVNRTAEHARELAARYGFEAAAISERPAQLAEADIVISAVPASELALTRPEIEAACRRRNGRPLLLIDAGVPRNIDPAAHEINGVFLHDIDDLRDVMKRLQSERQARVAEAERIITSIAGQFCSKLEAPRIVPIVVVLRQKLDEICRQELEVLRREAGPLADEASLETFACRLSQHLAGLLAREIRDIPDQREQERLTEAMQRLFHLEMEAAAAGARS